LEIGGVAAFGLCGGEEDEKEGKFRMTKPEIRINDEIQMTKKMRIKAFGFRHSSLVRISGFGFWAFERRQLIHTDLRCGFLGKLS
jgi:hypothetical protein